MTLNGEPWNQLTLFAEGTRANRLASPGNETEQTTNGTYGQNSQTLLGFYDPDTHCWKTSQVTLVSDLEQSLQTWPRAGMTRNGTAYQLPPSAHRTYATDFGLSLHGQELWPTPTAMTWAATGQRAKLTRKVQAGILSEEEKRSLQAGNRGKTNPQFLEWLMGFPIGWTDAEP